MVHPLSHSPVSCHRGFDDKRTMMPLAFTASLFQKTSEANESILKYHVESTVMRDC